MNIAEFQPMAKLDSPRAAATLPRYVLSRAAQPLHVRAADFAAGRAAGNSTPTQLSDGDELELYGDDLGFLDILRHVYSRPLCHKTLGAPPWP